jgi:hypothetical protein
MTRDIKTLLREAAANTGFMEKVPVLDPSGKPTGQFEYRWGKDGELGYLEWLARNHPGVFGSLYGKLIPFDLARTREDYSSRICCSRGSKSGTRVSRCTTASTRQDIEVPLCIN